MSPEVSWQTSGVGRQGPRERSSDVNYETQSVEGLIRQLISRVEESERRYSEALGELHARLDQLSKTTETVPALGDREEAETLERLRSQLSGLADRLEHPAAPGPAYEGFAKLDKMLSEAREETADLSRRTSAFSSPEKASAQGESAFRFPVAAGGSGFSAPAVEVPTLASEAASLDRRLLEMAARLERSIGEAMPTAAIQAINARMDEIARTFDQALRETPKIENLRSLERQVADMGQQLGEIGAQASRINVVEGQLHRLIERSDNTTFHIETMASKAANEAARLVASSSPAAERLEALHRDIVAMNEQNRATDDRLVDTLAAMHESLKGLIQQVERVRQTNQAPPSQTPSRLPPRKERAAEPPGLRPTLGPPTPPSPPRAEEPAPAGNDHPLRDGRPETGNARDETENAPVFGHSKRDFFADDALDLDATDPTDAGASFPMADTSMFGDDLVAAARRAAQAAAARAEARSQKPATPRNDETWNIPPTAAVPERRKRSLLMIVAVLLLLLSAGLLYGRLQSKLDAGGRPSTEQGVTPPSAEIMPAPTEPATEAAPAPDAGPASEFNPNTPPEAEAPMAPAGEAPAAPITLPDATPEAIPAPGQAQPEPQPERMAPHSTTPSVETQGAVTPPPVRLTRAQT